MLTASDTLIFAHGTGHGWGGPIEPWEFHPMLIHFPIAFLLSGVVVGLSAWWRGQLSAERLATGLFTAGVLSGVVTAGAGLLAMYTAPDNTAMAERLMPVHLWVQVAALVLFAVVSWLRWRAWDTAPGLPTRILGWVAAVVLIVGSGIGGYMVYHAGAAIEPRLLAPSMQEGHHHSGGEGSAGTGADGP